MGLLAKTESMPDTERMKANTIESKASIGKPPLNLVRKNSSLNAKQEEAGKISVAILDEEPKRYSSTLAKKASVEQYQS